MQKSGAQEMPRHVLVLSAAVVLCIIVEATVAASTKEKLCFKGSEEDPTGNITLSCPSGQVITIDEALFGRSKWLLCVISDGDCVEKTKIFHECESRNNCSRSFKTYSTKCGYASVMFISYTCLQVEPASVYSNTPTYATESTVASTTKKAEISRDSQIHETGKPSVLVNRESGSNLKEPGLIAGCVVAAVVTVIFLVIAITMVVRRLLHKNNPDDADAEADSVESKRYTFCVCFNCFSHIRNCQSYQEKKQDFMAAKMTSSDTVVMSHTDKHVYVDTDNSFFAHTEGQLSSHDKTVNIQQIADDDQLDSNSNSRKKHIIANEDVCRNDESENSPMVARVLNEDINGLNTQQNCRELQTNAVSDNSISEMAEEATSSTSKDSLEENGIPKNRNTNSTAACHSEGQQTQAGKNDQTLSVKQPTFDAISSPNQVPSVKQPTFDAVSIPNTQQGTVC